MNNCGILLLSILLLICVSVGSSWKCPRLNLKHATVSCRGYKGTERCSFKCLKGYVLNKDEPIIGQIYDTEKTITCKNGVWQGHPTGCKFNDLCKLEVVGSGHISCRANMRSYSCKITCGRRYQGTFYCHPELGITSTGDGHWNPRLPYCVRKPGDKMPSWAQRPLGDY